jgi:hypothetical protein
MCTASLSCRSQYTLLTYNTSGLNRDSSFYLTVHSARILTHFLLVVLLRNLTAVIYRQK